MTSSDELRPCPFCGGTDIGISTKYGHAECGQCGATGPWPQHDEEFLAAELRHYWCLRPIEDALSAEVDRLKVAEGEAMLVVESQDASIAALKAELAKYTEPLTDEQRKVLFGDTDFCNAMDTDALDLIDAAIRRVRGER